MKEGAKERLESGDRGVQSGHSYFHPESFGETGGMGRLKSRRRLRNLSKGGGREEHYQGRNRLIPERPPRKDSERAGKPNSQQRVRISKGMNLSLLPSIPLRTKGESPSIEEGSSEKGGSRIAMRVWGRRSPEESQKQGGYIKRIYRGGGGNPGGTPTKARES